MIGGRRDGAMRRAALLADGWMPMLFSPRAYARSVSAIHEHAGGVGRPLEAFRWMCMLSVAVTNDVVATRRAAVAEMSARSHPITEEALGRVATIGDVDTVAEVMREYVDAGVDHFVIAPLATGDVRELAHQLLELVAPQLGGRPAVQVTSPGPREEGS